MCPMCLGRNRREPGHAEAPPPWKPRPPHYNTAHHSSQATAPNHESPHPVGAGAGVGPLHAPLGGGGASPVRLPGGSDPSAESAAVLLLRASEAWVGASRRLRTPLSTGQARVRRATDRPKPPRSEQHQTKPNKNGGVREKTERRVGRRRGEEKGDGKPQESNQRERERGGGGEKIRENQHKKHQKSE